MIKESKIISYNPYLKSILVDFDGMKIQFTGTIKEGTKTAYVRYENDIATIVSKEDYEKSLQSKGDKKAKKVKATETNLVCDGAELEAVEDETEEISK